MTAETSNDHDNIITLIANVKTLTEEVRLMRDTTRDDIKALQTGKLDRSEFLEFKSANAQERKEKIGDVEKAEKELNDKIAAHQKTLDMLVRAYFLGLGALGIIELVVPFVVRYYTGV